MYYIIYIYILYTRYKYKDKHYKYFDILTNINSLFLIGITQEIKSERKSPSLEAEGYYAIHYH